MKDGCVFIIICLHLPSFLVIHSSVETDTRSEFFTSRVLIVRNLQQPKKNYYRKSYTGVFAASDELMR